VEVCGILVVSQPIALKTGVGTSTHGIAYCACMNGVSAGSRDALQRARKVRNDQWIAAQLGRLVKMPK
jgi:hypothetical protein